MIKIHLEQKRVCDLGHDRAQEMALSVIARIVSYDMHVALDKSETIPITTTNKALIL